ncbi:MAG: VOC family protein [Candidatus Nanopelagicales bacterium]
MLVALVVDLRLDDEFARLAAAGAAVVTAPETEPWGERYCQVQDPNGIVFGQLVEWVDTPPA